MGMLVQRIGNASVGDDVLEVCIGTDEFEVLAFGKHTATSYLEYLLQRNAAVYGCAAIIVVQSALTCRCKYSSWNVHSTFAPRLTT